MFENLTDKLQRVFKDLRGEGKLTEQNIEAALKQIRMALLEADVNFKVVKELVAAILEKSARARGLDLVIARRSKSSGSSKDELVGLLGGKKSRLRFSNDPPSHFLIVGLQGSGKTTSTGKLARWLSKQGRRPLMVSVDVYRPAAREQLRVLASQLDLPIYTGKPEETTPLELAKGARREANQTGRDIVLIDTAGRLHVDDELMVELEQLQAEFEPSEILFVADAMTGQDAVKSAAEFHERLGITGVVLTKMDGDARGGAALSIRHVTKRPVKFIGTGEKLSALEQFYPERIVSRILGMGDVMSLIEKVEEQIDQKQAIEMQRKVLDNDFTLEDFRQQLKQLKKLGPLESVLGMLPQVGPLQGLQNVDVDPKEMLRIEAIISSMTFKERLNHEVINGRRRRRIAKGSGTSVQQVNQLLRQYRQMRRMMRSLIGGGKKNKRRLAQMGMEALMR